MNNLLRTLTESRVKTQFPDCDLKLLLTTVKEGRRQGPETKLSDPFYDSLEGLLLDLRTVTIDNHDAEAFLKPVLKAEVPDYYDVIHTPMDLQTMLKKVKQKSYKSKREFKDDLDLIYSNCFTYNATENHPLRQCVKRLKLKAERLLNNITDRKERLDPVIPPELAGTGTHHPKLNGRALVNGTSHTPNLKSHASTRSPSFPPTYKPIGTPRSTHSSTPGPSTGPLIKPPARNDAAFADTPALIRTPSGMATFLRLSTALDALPAPSDSTPLLASLRALAPAPTTYAVEVDLSDAEPERSASPSLATDTAHTGEKRKLNGTSHFHSHSQTRPRKRTRLTTHYPAPLPVDAADDEATHLWWAASQSSALFANGLPEIPYPSSAPPHPPSSPPHPPSSRPGSRPCPYPAVKRRKRRRKGTEGAGPNANANPNSLLARMNSNIRTMKRVRHTHAKFSALGLGGAGNEDGEGGGGGGGGGGGDVAMPMVGGVVLEGLDEDAVGVDDDRIDERPWRVKGRRPAEEDIGEVNATDCLTWMGGKVLQHAGFQGTSKVALDVLAGVTSEYLMNVGRTIKYLCDKHSNTMTAEEIILHTLFESGTPKIQDLERYISDDVERYGTRLGDLEKKLVGAYRETVTKMVDNGSQTAVEDGDDEGLFDDEDEEDSSALALGDFADTLGVDYFGLKELGIAEEFGMSSLTIPKSLLKGKKKRSKLSSAIVVPKEPPPPFPPPPPFLPLTAAKVEDQIGLLKPYYFGRLAALPIQQYPQLSLPTMGPSPYPSMTRIPYGYPGSIARDDMGRGNGNGNGHGIPSPPPDIPIPDDPPNPAQLKMGPLGQIVKAGAGSGVSKKKAKTASGAGAGGAGGEAGASQPKKKKGATGVGTGNGRKKKLLDAAQAQAQAQVQGVPFPPVVAASA